MEQIDTKKGQQVSLKKEKIQQLINDPIEGYYNDFKKNIDVQLEDIANRILQENKEAVDKTEELKDHILFIEKEVEHRHKQDNINFKKIINLTIIIFCFILVGLFLLHLYFKNKKVIDQYNLFKANNQKIIDNTNNQKNEIIIQAMKKITPYKFAQEIFWANGLELKPTANLADLDTLHLPVEKNGKVVGFQTSLNVRFKSTDCYLANYKEYWIDKVKTSASIVVTTHKNDMTETNTLWATHEEPTPRISIRNWYIQKTNFKPGFSFTTHTQNVKKRDKTLFSNHEFAMRYGIGAGKYKLETEQSLNEYFTPLAQNQYLDWSKHYADPKIIKKNEYLLTKATENAELAYFFTKHPPYRFSETLCLKYSDTLKTNILYTMLKTKTLISEFMQRFVYVNLSPVISREWYHNDNKYRIGSNYIYEEYNPVSGFDSNCIAEKFTSLHLLAIKNTSNVDFFFSTESGETKFGVNVFNLNLITYKTHNRIDPVPVYFEGKKYIINVPYVEYEEKPIPMSLYVIFKNNEKDKTTFFTWSQNLNRNIFDDSSKLIEELTTYFSEDDKIKKEVHQHHIKQLHSLMNQASIPFEDFNFISDDDGYFLLVRNDANKITAQVDEQICSWMRKASF